MTCPRCGGWVVIEPVPDEDGTDPDIEQWHCLPCGWRGDDDTMKRTADAIARQKATLAAKRAAQTLVPRLNAPTIETFMEKPDPAVAEPNELTAADLRRAMQPETIERRAQVSEQDTALSCLDAKIQTYRDAIAVLESAKQMLVA